VIAGGEVAAGDKITVMAPVPPLRALEPV
jgi:hypothetical protein